jgi:superfamily II DNA/RNA helicase
MSFELLGLSEEVLTAVNDAGYETPTPIQKAAIPSVLQGRDILGIAQTGTGKTAGFTLPMIDILAQGRARARMPRSIILEPTRELAAQVAESFEKYGKNTKLSMALLIGGVSFEEQIKKLDRGVDVLIATPGRMLDHFDRGRILMTGVEILVIDEADRMLDMGFIPDVEKICGLITKKHQTLFFSATMLPPIKRLVDRFLDDPKEIKVDSGTKAGENIKQAVVWVEKMQKRHALRSLLKSEDVQNGIVFCNTKREVNAIYESLKRHNISAGQLHGDMAQSERLEVLQAFKDNKIQILCASDVAARGLDIPTVSHVFNYDVPTQAEDYIHRIGRTGRAGREGFSFTLAEPRREKRFVEAIEKMAKIKIKVVTIDGTSDNKSRDNKSRDNKPSGNKKPNGKDSYKAKTSDNGRNKPDHKSNKDKSEKKWPKDHSTEKDAKPQEKKWPKDQHPKNKRDNDRGRKKSKRYDSQADIGEMNKGSDPIVGMGEHMPAFLQTAKPAKK